MLPLFFPLGSEIRTCTHSTGGLARCHTTVLQLKADPSSNAHCFFGLENLAKMQVISSSPLFFYCAVASSWLSYPQRMDLPSSSKIVHLPPRTGSLPANHRPGCSSMQQPLGTSADEIRSVCVASRLAKIDISAHQPRSINSEGCSSRSHLSVHDPLFGIGQNDRRPEE